MTFLVNVEDKNKFTMYLGHMVQPECTVIRLKLFLKIILYVWFIFQVRIEDKFSTYYPSSLTSSPSFFPFISNEIMDYSFIFFNV